MVTTVYALGRLGKDPTGEPDERWHCEHDTHFKQTAHALALYKKRKAALLKDTSLSADIRIDRISEVNREIGFFEEKVASHCTCMCGEELQCTIRHKSHFTGMTESYNHCKITLAPTPHPTRAPTMAPTLAPTTPVCARIGETASVAIRDDIFLKGAYLQIGINRHGYCGTHAKVPVSSGWVRTSHINTGLCAVADPHKDGWDRKAAGKKDNFHGPFTIPGSPQEAWVLGYYHYGSRRVSDFGRAGFRDPNGFKCTIKDTTNKAMGKLGATSVCKNSELEVSQVISFAACDTNVNWDVTVKALSGGITKVVYLRNLDPDNDQDTIFRKTGGSRGSTYVTRNTILGQKAAGSKYSLVASTSDVGSDSFFGLFSRDSRSRVRYGGFNNDDPWTSEFDKVTSTYRTGATTLCDCAIDMQFRLGSIASGKSTTFNMRWVFDKKEDLDKI
jgi:hypothetical protein